MFRINLITTMKAIRLFAVLCTFFVLEKTVAQNSRPPDAARMNSKPILVRGPYLQVATDTSMVIRWRTDVLTRSRVRYGSLPTRLDKMVDGLALTMEHEIKVSGLEPLTKYFYSI